MHPIIRELQKDNLRTDLPDFQAGDTITLYYKIKEGEKERIQPFQGVVLQKKKFWSYRNIYGKKNVRWNWR